MPVYILLFCILGFALGATIPKRYSIPIYIILTIIWALIFNIIFALTVLVAMVVGFLFAIYLKSTNRF